MHLLLDSGNSQAGSLPSLLSVSCVLEQFLEYRPNLANNSASNTTDDGNAGRLQRSNGHDEQSSTNCSWKPYDAPNGPTRLSKSSISAWSAANFNVQSTAWTNQRSYWPALNGYSTAARWHYYFSNNYSTELAPACYSWLVYSFYTLFIAIFSARWKFRVKPEQGLE